jgi:unsaturated chondroitin disaccharide hydrolase
LEHEWEKGTIFQEIGNIRSKKLANLSVGLFGINLTIFSMRSIFYLSICSIFLLSCNRDIKTDTLKSDQELIENITAQEQYALILIKQINSSETAVFPRSLKSSGEIHLVGKRDWTSGFYPGVLWLMYDLTLNNSWINEAAKYTKLLESEQFNDSNHDIGFKMMSSYGQGYRLTGNKVYKEILVQSARTLITRFDENIGCIRSWDHHKDKWDYPVIIDNMINLELLFWASKETGDPVFANIAVKHAETTLKNHFREDFSCYHVVSYDTVTGEVAAKQTRQGYSDESSWARGQAWALYGYTMAYRETKIPDFLNQAEKVANYIFNIEGLPKDYIPFWDFDAPGIPNQPRDASAAAIMASALYELSSFSDINKESYITNASRIMNALSSEEYFNKRGTNQGYLLRHSTGSKPLESEVDVPLIYADYYYLEALKRKVEFDKTYNKLSHN